MFASFGLFTNGLEEFDKAYDAGLITKIFTTNLVYRTDELKKRAWYREVEMSKYIAYIIDTINYDKSLSEALWIRQTESKSFWQKILTASDKKPRLRGAFSRRNQMDMTKGPLGKEILFFSIPLILSNLLQVCFNMSDIAVVGKFAGSEALGAVGSTTILVTLFTGFLIGIGNGVNVLAARFMGFGDEKGLKDSVNTSFVICLITGALLLAVGLPFPGTLLEV